MMTAAYSVYCCIFFPYYAYFLYIFAYCCIFSSIFCIFSCTLFHIFILERSSGINWQCLA